MRRLAVVLVLAALGVLTARGAVPCGLLPLQPDCRVAVFPGPADNVLELVDVGEASAGAAAGEFLMTTVRVDPTIGWRDWLRVAVSPAASDAPRSTVLPDGASIDEVTAENAALMDDSQQQAAIAALRAAGYDVDPRSVGARILYVLDDSAAADVGLDAGEVIVSIDGRPVRTPQDVEAALGRRDPGEHVTVGIRDPDGHRRRERLRLTAGDDDPTRPVIGVVLGHEVDLPVDVRFDAGVVGGPSAGLVFALSLVDLLDSRDLTGGRVVAGTGTIQADGRVGPVSSVGLKLLGALDREDGGPPAQVFLVPAANLDDAQAAPVERDVLLVPVDDLDGALDALRRLRTGGVPEGAVRRSGG